jgi:hypothetical protein
MKTVTAHSRSAANSEAGPKLSERHFPRKTASNQPSDASEPVSESIKPVFSDTYEIGISQKFQFQGWYGEVLNVSSLNV